VRRQRSRTYVEIPAEAWGAHLCAGALAGSDITSPTSIKPQPNGAFLLCLRGLPEETVDLGGGVTLRRRVLPPEVAAVASSTWRDHDRALFVRSLDLDAEGALLAPGAPGGVEYVEVGGKGAGATERPAPAAGRAESVASLDAMPLQGLVRWAAAHGIDVVGVPTKDDAVALVSRELGYAP
jgi:hypothetical protein